MYCFHCIPYYCLYTFVFCISSSLDNFFLQFFISVIWSEWTSLESACVFKYLYFHIVIFTSECNCICVPVFHLYFDDTPSCREELKVSLSSASWGTSVSPTPNYTPTPSRVFKCPLQGVSSIFCKQCVKAFLPLLSFRMVSSNMVFQSLFQFLYSGSSEWKEYDSLMDKFPQTSLQPQGWGRTILVSSSWTSNPGTGRWSSI